MRIARVLRLVRFSPGLRTIVSALLRSLPGVGGFLALAMVTLYVYGMAGWLIFKDHYPEQYGNIGAAVLTLFVLFSLETLPDLIEQGMAVSPWTLVYYVSYVLITVNLLLNILIAVIVNSMEEVRRLEMTEGLAAGSRRGRRRRTGRAGPDRDQPAPGRPAGGDRRAGAGAADHPGRRPGREALASSCRVAERTSIERGAVTRRDDVYLVRNRGCGFFGDRDGVDRPAGGIADGHGTRFRGQQGLERSPDAMVVPVAGQKHDGGHARLLSGQRKPVAHHPDTGHRQRVVGHVEINCDESGYEGEKLIDTTTPFFAHASLEMTVGDAAGLLRELRRRIRSPATQYKSGHLLREKNRSALEWFLGPQSPVYGHGSVFLIDKAYHVVTQLADLLDLDPAGIDRSPYFLAAANDLLRAKDRPGVVDEFFRVSGYTEGRERAELFRVWLREDPVVNSVLDPLVPAWSRPCATGGR